MTRRVVFTTMQMLKKKGGDTEVCLQSSKIHPNLQNLISSSCDFCCLKCGFISSFFYMTLQSVLWSTDRYSSCTSSFLKQLQTATASVSTASASAGRGFAAQTAPCGSARTRRSWAQIAIWAVALTIVMAKACAFRCLPLKLIRMRSLARRWASARVITTTPVTTARCQLRVFRLVKKRAGIQEARSANFARASAWRRWTRLLSASTRRSRTSTLCCKSVKLNWRRKGWNFHNESKTMFKVEFHRQLSFTSVSVWLSSECHSQIICMTSKFLREAATRFLYFLFFCQAFILCAWAFICFALNRIGMHQ